MLVKLNIGCGDFPAPDPWVNIDVVPTRNPPPDLVADLTLLPYDDESVDAIYAGHVLEHVPWSQVGTALLEFHRVLKTDAELMIVGPDILDGLDSDENALVDAIISGENNGTPGFHAWTCFERLLLWKVRQFFFNAKRIGIGDVPDRWPIVSRAVGQCAVGAIKRL